jgi:hypothetical protein
MHPLRLAVCLAANQRLKACQRPYSKSAASDKLQHNSTPRAALSPIFHYSKRLDEFRSAFARRCSVETLHPWTVLCSAC